jgi:hypothetical protein
MSPCVTLQRLLLRVACVMRMLVACDAALPLFEKQCIVTVQRVKQSMPAHAQAAEALQQQTAVTTDERMYAQSATSIYLSMYV